MIPPRNDATISSITKGVRAASQSEWLWRDYLRECATPLTIGCGLFAFGALTLIIMCDPAFFYPRMRNDQLNYYLMSAQLAANHTWQISAAENLPPISYVRVPSVLRAPIFFLFSDFDKRIRAIQLSNVALLVMLGILQGAFLHRFLPVFSRWRRWIVVFPFIYLAIEASWQRNLLLPLGDVFFALFSMVGIFAFRGVSWKPPFDRRSTILISFGTFTALMAFGVKFLGAFLFTYPLVLAPWRQRAFWNDRTVRILIPAVISLLLISVAAAWNLLATYYNAAVTLLSLPDYRESVADWMSSFFFAALPSQIIPNFSYLYASSFHQPAQFIDVSYVTFANVWLLVLGGLISIAIGLGAWLGRRSLLPEIVYVVACAAVVAPVTTSTTRYLTYFEPMLLVFFAYAIRSAWLCIPQAQKNLAPIAFAVSASAVVLTSLQYIRIESRGAVNGISRLSGYMRYERDVADVYRRFRRCINGLSKAHSRLLPGYSLGAWKAIENMEYYVPDHHLAQRVTQTQIYLALDCERKFCGPPSLAEALLLKKLRLYAPVCLKDIYTDVTPFAEARLFRVILERNGKC